MEEHQKSSINQEQTPYVPELGWGRLAFLGATSMALCSFVPLSIFAPFPLAVSFVLYGRSKGHLLGAVCTVLFFLMAITLKLPIVVGALFVVAYVYAIVIGEIILRGIHPAKGLLQGGAILFAIITIIGGVYILAGETSVVNSVEKLVVVAIEKFKQDNSAMLSVGGPEARAFGDLIDNPRKLAYQIIYWGPATLFVSVFITLWLGLFMLLRNSRFWRRYSQYPYMFRDLARFKAPDYLIYPLISSLALLVGGEYFLGEFGSVVGGSILYIVGLFYFFHGLGVYLDFLTHIRIMRVMRTVLTIITVVFAWRVLVLVGIFDTWVNFRRFLKKKKEGDSI